MQCWFRVNITEMRYQCFCKTIVLFLVCSTSYESVTLGLCGQISCLDVFLIIFSAPPAQQQPAQAGQSADVQAQWAEYYRQLGYAYYGQQGGQQPGGAPAEQKV